jgi:hypothetical protein
MKTFRYFITTILGISCTWFGIWLRLKAHDLAWPLEWGYSGPREDTIWAIHERAYQDISLAILAFGLLLLAMILFRWLRAPSANNEHGA